jgi:hypothetical protein
MLEVMSTSVCTGLNPYNFIRKQFLRICVRKYAVHFYKVLEVMSTSVDTNTSTNTKSTYRSLSAQRLSEHTVFRIERHNLGFLFHIYQIPGSHLGLLEAPLYEEQMNQNVYSESSICSDSSARVATRYGLDGPGIESWWGRDFPHPPRPALGPTRPPIQWAPGLSQGKSGRGVALTTHPI